MAQTFRTEIFRIVGTMRGQLCEQALSYRKTAYESMDLLSHEGRRAAIGWLCLKVKGIESKSARMFVTLRRPIQIAALLVERLDRKVKKAEQSRREELHHAHRSAWSLESTVGEYYRTFTGTPFAHYGGETDWNTTKGITYVESGDCIFCFSNDRNFVRR